MATRKIKQATNFRDVSSGLRFEAPITEDFGDSATDVVPTLDMPSRVSPAGLLALHGFDGGSYAGLSGSAPERAEAYGRAYQPWDDLNEPGNPGASLQLRRRMKAGGVYDVKKAGSFEPRDYTPAPINNDLGALWDDAVESFKTNPIVPAILGLGLFWYMTRHGSWFGGSSRGSR